MTGLIEAVKNLWAKEPTLILSALTAAVVFVCAKVGVVVPEQTVAESLAYIVPILLAGVGVRSVVTPAAKAK